MSRKLSACQEQLSKPYTESTCDKGTTWVLQCPWRSIRRLWRPVVMLRTRRHQLRAQLFEKSHMTHRVHWINEMFANPAHAIRSNSCFPGLLIWEYPQYSNLNVYHRRRTNPGPVPGYEAGPCQARKPCVNHKIFTRRAIASKIHDNGKSCFSRLLFKKLWHHQNLLL